MVLNEKEERLEIWRALSDLFLDTEVDEATCRYIADTVEDSGLTIGEVENILWYEVYPVLESNMRRVAGVWGAWPDDWLLENLTIAKEAGAIKGDTSIIQEIKRCWSQVVKFVPNKNA